MANFVDGRKFGRISGQILHVPLHGKAQVGLWGGYDYSGLPLEVVSSSVSIYRVSPIKPRGDLRMFDLTGVNLGETVLNAVTSGGSVWDSVEIHVHHRRKRQLPRFEELLANYPGDEESSEDFRKRVGGQVDNEQLVNTCTMRLSQAFNYAGQPLPQSHPGLRTVTGGDKRFYAIRVAEFKRFMLETYGPPDLVRKPPGGASAGVLRADFAHLRGVICFEVHFNDATGHFSLWDGSKSVHGDYFARAYRVSLWLAG